MVGGRGFAPVEQATTRENTNSPVSTRPGVTLDITLARRELRVAQSIPLRLPSRTDRWRERRSASTAAQQSFETKLEHTTDSSSPARNRFLQLACCHRTEQSGNGPASGATELSEYSMGRNCVATEFLRRANIHGCFYRACRNERERLLSW
jgi:hypothetical protein